MYRSYTYKEHTNKCMSMVKSGVPICIIDLETTGKSAKNSYIFQFAGIKCIMDENMILRVKDNLSVFIKPEIQLTEKIEEMTGFTNDDLIDKPKEQTVFPYIKRFMDNCIMCSHNTAFEESFMTAMYARNGCVFQPIEILDTLKMSRDLHKDEKVHKLGVIAERYGIAEGVHFHDARGDTIVCGKLLSRFLMEYNEVKNEVQTDKIIPKVLSISYWEGKRHDQRRIYIFTNLGTVWFSVIDHTWGEKDRGTIEKINMDDLIRQVLAYTKADSLIEFSKFKGSLKC